MKNFTITAAGVVLAALAAIVATTPVEAGCRRPYEIGTWINKSVEDAELARIEITHSNDCWDPRVRIWKPDTGPAWHVEVFGECGEACSWGRVGAEQTRLYRGLDVARDPESTVPVGRVKIYPIAATFWRDDSLKYVYLYVTSDLAGGSTNGNRLAVRVYTDYPDNGPPDKVDDYEFWGGREAYRGPSLTFDYERY